MSPVGVSPATCACNDGLFLLESLPVTVIHYYRKNCANKLLWELFFFCCKKSCFVHSHWECLVPSLRHWGFGAQTLVLPPECPVVSGVEKQNLSISASLHGVSLGQLFNHLSTSRHLSNSIDLCLGKNLWLHKVQAWSLATVGCS